MTNPTDSQRPRLFSAMQPTADSLHLGNYLGAMVNWVSLQHEYQALYSVPDLHAITVATDPADLRRRTRVTAAQFIACGIDPRESIVFVQSHVPAHAELAWLLECFTGYGEASRMTQFKDKMAKQGEQGASLGLFAYPALMAADILLYGTHVVPVGEDQKQHLELSRNLAQRFNRRFDTEVFTVPEPIIPKAAARVMDLAEPTSKMSKSAQSPAGRIDILDDPKVVAKRIKSAVTDADTVIAYDRENKPGVSNLLEIHSALSGKTIPEVVADFDGKMYGHLKVAVAELVGDVLGPIRQEVERLLDDPAELERILASGAERAAQLAQPTLVAAYDAVGFLPRSARPDLPTP